MGAVKDRLSGKSMVSCIRFCTEIRVTRSVTAVRILTAFEDFMLNSVGAVPGKLAKLRFVAGLKRDGRQYQHWGLSRAHGAEAAQRALRAAHEQLLANLLQTRAHELEGDVVPMAKLPAL